MRRTTTIIAATALTAALALSAAPAGARVTHARVDLRHTALGMILVNGRGRTLYAFSRDRRGKEACQNISHCLAIWPPLTTGGKPIAGPGVQQALIGTIRLKDGAKQVTYNGHPLYTYIGDVRAAQTSYVNIFQLGGFWPAVNAAGHEVR